MHFGTCNSLLLGALVLLTFSSHHLVSGLENVEHHKVMHVRTFTGTVAAEHYSYYRITFEGRVIIRMHTLHGDADLYVSTESLRPTWMNYTMKSYTCGEDEVILESSDKRPVGVGVYGHVLFPESEIELSVYIDRSADVDEEDLQQNHWKVYREVDAAVHHQPGAGSSSPTSSYEGKTSEDEDYFESVGWNMLFDFLHVIIRAL